MVSNSAGRRENIYKELTLSVFAASFSVSLLKREHTAENEKTFLCLATGGYPKPSVYWLINNTLEPPKGSVRTHTEFDLYSHFFNVTSNLTISFSKHDNVSCIVENLSMNETLRYTCKLFTGDYPRNAPAPH